MEFRTLVTLVFKEPQAMNYAALDEVSDHELPCS
jgi:hypothetical protein